MSYDRPTIVDNNSDALSSCTEPSPSGSSTKNSSHPRHVPGTAWQHHLSAGFTQLSEQLLDAAQILSTVPPSPDDAMTSLLERLACIEERQKNLEAEMRDLRETFSAPKQLPATEIEELLKAHVELYKLDQERLHGRLQNALATKSLSPVKMLPMKNRKIPPNAPGTRGEFEHLTKERYEGLMTCYDIPISGDTAMKRDALRIFLGIPATPLEKK